MKKILVAQPFGIGDALFVTPFLRALKEEAHAERVDMILGSRTREIFETNPFVDRIFTVDMDRLRERGKVKSFFDMVGEEMDKTGDYKDNRITSVPEKIAFVKEHEDLFFIEKSFFDQIRNDVDRDCLKVFFDKTIGFIDDERDNNYWKELLVKIVKKLIPC